MVVKTDAFSLVLIGYLTDKRIIMGKRPSKF